MKRLVIAAFAAVVGLGMITTDAEAARVGGGKSFGMNRNASTMKAPASPPPSQAAPASAAASAAAPAAAGAATAAKSGMSRWMGPLAGLAAGLGIAALMSHLGMGEAMGNFLMIALLAVAAVVVFRMIFRKKQPEAAASGMNYAGAGAGINATPRVEPMQFDAGKVGSGGTAAAVADTTAAGQRSIPADFDVDGFVRQAKLNFMRMQAANDRGDMDDIKQFTAPEIFAEIQMQYQERGKSAQQTDVLDLHAELLDVTEEAALYVASVRFYGQLRESANAATESFDELWHLTKARDGKGGWLIAGIQQFQ
jgi:predicted lipid-binding transport protein (Tim44 family)